MKNNIKRTLVAFSFIALAASFSSCNRGYGCPNNFSMGDTVSKAVSTVVTAMTKK